jgi:hypothetical protein
MNITAMGRDTGPQQIIGPDGDRLTTNVEKRQAFLQRFTSQLQRQGEIPMQQTSSLCHQKCLDEEADWDERTVEFGELDRVLKLIRKDTVPGPDGVRYTYIKAMDEGNKVKIAEHIDTYMRAGTLPDTWSDCMMAVLHKPANDHTALKGYRIMTMANV